MADGTERQEVLSLTLPSGREVQMAHASMEFLSELLRMILREVLVRPKLEELAPVGEIPLDDLLFIVRWGLHLESGVTGPARFKM